MLAPPRGTGRAVGARTPTPLSPPFPPPRSTVNPGYGWTASGGVECVAGTFNPGYNTRACTRCPGGLTTTSPGSNRSQDCVAPAGNYFLAGKAVPCAQGTYKPSAGNQDCLKCPAGFTTEPGTVGKIPAISCTCERVGVGVWGFAPLAASV